MWDSTCTRFPFGLGFEVSHSSTLCFIVKHRLLLLFVVLRVAEIYFQLRFIRFSFTPLIIHALPEVAVWEEMIGRKKPSPYCAHIPDSKWILRSSSWSHSSSWSRCFSNATKFRFLAKLRASALWASWNHHFFVAIFNVPEAFLNNFISAAEEE